LLIDELKALSNPQEARPKNYYIYSISTIIIILNIFTAFFRIIGGIMIFVYVTILKVVKKREEYEREERIMAVENNRNFSNQTLILNTKANFGIPSNLSNAQLINNNNNNKNKLFLGSNGVDELKNNRHRNNSNSIIEEDYSMLSDKLISDSRIKNTMFNRVFSFYDFLTSLSFFL